MSVEHRKILLRHATDYVARNPPPELWYWSKDRYTFSLENRDALFLRNILNMDGSIECHYLTKEKFVYRDWYTGDPYAGASDAVYLRNGDNDPVIVEAQRLLDLLIQITRSSELIPEFLHHVKRLAQADNYDAIILLLLFDEQGNLRKERDSLILVPMPE